jgi:two-component system CheB/CheR fusion protein
MTKKSATNIKSKKEADDFLVVGIGASAGGLVALKEFFLKVPADSGIVYVVILHLSPNHDSQLASILQANAVIPVTQVQKKTRVKPNNIYVIPPDRHLTMIDGAIDVTKNVTFEDRRAPVDIFFRTLADSKGSRAACVVLSGSGANGSMGMKRIKEMGGAAFVQHPNEAEFAEMPRNSIATDLVDAILPVASIPSHIIEYRDNLYNTNLAIENVRRSDDEQKALHTLFTNLRLKIGHDFSNYKQATLLRRIERRLNIRNLPTLSAYVEYVTQHPEELVALLKDLLISVTNFFRDPLTFDFLNTNVIPALFRGKPQKTR